MGRRKGRIIVRGKLHTRAQNKRADYVLFHRPNMPIAVIEAKDNKHSLGDGMQQGLGYAEMLQVPFVFSSNGDGFLFHNKIAKDGVIERELALYVPDAALGDRPLAERTRIIVLNKADVPEALELAELVRPDLEAGPARPRRRHGGLGRGAAHHGRRPGRDGAQTIRPHRPEHGRHGRQRAERGLRRAGSGRASGT